MHVTKLLDKCEQELNWLWMSINVKSCCMRVGPRCDTVCANITTGDGRQLPWAKEIRYLGIHIVQSRHFKSAIDNHKKKKSFFRSVNAIFGKVGRIATDEVILQLVFFKVYTRVIVWFRICIINYIWCEITRLYLYNRFILKLFKTADIEYH